MTWTRKTPLRTKTREPSFCVRFSPDDRIVCSGHFDGTIVGYDVASLSNKFEVNVTPKDSKVRVPVTSLAHRPGTGKPILLVGCSNGCVERWDLRALEKANMIQEANNEVYAVDYREDGHYFASVGRDSCPRIYDDLTGQQIRKWVLTAEFPANPQAARMYSICFAHDDMNLVLCGGWGQTVHVLDMRDPNEGRGTEIFGPFLCGDALDIRGGTILTGSNRNEQRIQLWDLQGTRSVELPWPSQNQFLPLCAKFSQDPTGDFISVGGGGAQGLKQGCFVLERKTNRVVVDQSFEKPINTCHFAHRDPLVAFGDGDGAVHIFESRTGKH